MPRIISALLAISAVLLSLTLPAAATGSVILDIKPEKGTSEPIEFDRTGLEALPQVTVNTKTPWHDGVVVFEGPLIGDVLKVTGFKGVEIEVIALNGYRAKIPVSDLQEFGPILALKENGEYMRIRDRGPIFVIYPFDQKPQINNEIYYSRSVWQVREIVIR